MSEFDHRLRISDFPNKFRPILRWPVYSGAVRCTFQILGYKNEKITTHEHDY